MKIPTCALKSPFPSAKDINRWVADAIAAFKNVSMAMAPATTLKIPKSVAPKAAKINLVEYNDINTVIAIRAYKNPVFFATLLACCI
ncbi:hypothetical protein ABXZ32_11780 [Sediminicola luteus]|uniref:Uncharacterized protein n=1 Tax=Sediminicola luteus TaxID=319238 RepID=A0ABV2TXS8_9FLAO